MDLIKFFFLFACFYEIIFRLGKNMPSGIGGSYRSLGEDVYRSTTVSKEKFSVVESVKKAFNLIGNNRTNQGSFIVTEEDGGNDKKSVALLRYGFFVQKLPKINKINK